MKGAKTREGEAEFEIQDPIKRTFFPTGAEIRHQRGRPGFTALPRPEATHRHRQGDHPGPQDPAAGRGHLCSGHREREGTLE